MANLTGTDEANIITGTSFADWIRGLDGADRLYGGNGNDRIDGGQGNDFMTGGEGADRFVFTSGTDRIRDFESGDDDIDLSGLRSVSDYDDVMAVALQSGGHVVFNFAEGRLILVL